MGLDKNSIDARSSMIKKYIFSFTATVLLEWIEQRKKSVAPYHHQKEYISVSVYSTTTWDLEKFNCHSTSTKKNYFPITVILWCMGLGKNVITLDLNRKK